MSSSHDLADRYTLVRFSNNNNLSATYQAVPRCPRDRPIFVKRPRDPVAETPVELAALACFAACGLGAHLLPLWPVTYGGEGHYLASPWRDGRELQRARDDLRLVRRLPPALVATVLLATYAIGDYDRHGGNYFLSTDSADTADSAADGRGAVGWLYVLDFNAAFNPTVRLNIWNCGLSERAWPTTRAYLHATIPPEALRTVAAALPVIWRQAAPLRNPHATARRLEVVRVVACRERPTWGDLHAVSWDVSRHYGCLGEGYPATSAHAPDALYTPLS